MPLEADGHSPWRPLRCDLIRNSSRTHDGQTYLLPTMMQHVPVTGVVPMQ